MTNQQQPQQPTLAQANAGKLAEIVKRFRTEIEEAGMTFGALFIGQPVLNGDQLIGMATGFIIPDDLTSQQELSLIRDMGEHLMHMALAVEQRERAARGIIIPGKG